MPENDGVTTDAADDMNAAHAGAGRSAGAAGGGAMKRLLVLVAMVPMLVAATCGDQNACDHPPAGIGAIVTDVQASGDPCAGQPPLHVLAWFTRQGVRYPLRCGKTGRGGYGYLHITQDPTDDGGVGHGDPVNDASFAAEITNTLANGVEAPQGGGNWRYTVRYSDAQAICLNAWGFRVVLAKQPTQPDGHPAGIITAFRYSSPPTYYP